MTPSTSTPKRFSLHNPFLAWCEICTMWKPDLDVLECAGVWECRPCREAREAVEES